MATPAPLRCRCGQVQGEVGTDHAYVRASCYCRFCRAYAQWLGTPGLLDAAGGVDIVAMPPSQLRLTAGQSQVACMTLGERSILRWYAACCRTPLGNTPRTPATHYVGVSTACLEGAGDAVDAAFGPAGRCVLNTESATAPVRKTRLAFLLGGWHIMAGVLGAKVRGLRGSPFFDAGTGSPISTPEVVHRASPGSHSGQ
ncbi:MAG: DUF6151 family protein [Pseudomonadota bacterium]|nr:DUF6151 family protein [Pseudomonadota bacterium]